MKAAELRDLGADELGVEGARPDRSAVPDAHPEVDGPARSAGQDAHGAPRSGADQDRDATEEGSNRTVEDWMRLPIQSRLPALPVQGTYGSEI